MPYPDSTRFKVQFVDEMHGWVSSYRGPILQTTDGGATWKEHRFTEETSMNEIVFIDRENGWLHLNGCAPGNYCYYVKPFRTTDGGSTWIRCAFPERTGVYRKTLGYFDINYVTKDIALFHGYPKDPNNLYYYYYMTTDGGATWNTIPEYDNYMFFQDFFPRDSANWVLFLHQYQMADVPSQVRCLRTTDMGKTWRRTMTWYDNIAQNIVKLDSSRFLIFNDSYHERTNAPYGTYFTSNEGETWDTLGYPFIAKTAVIPNDEDIWAIDNRDITLYKGTPDLNTGNLYKSKLNAPVAHWWDGVLMYPEKVRWIDFRDGRIYALTAAGKLIVFEKNVVSVQPAAEFLDGGIIRIISIRPNPCGGDAVLSYDIAEQAPVSFEIFNSIGVKAMEYRSEAPMQIGRHILAIQTNTLKTGFYILAVKSLKGMAYRKFLVIKP